jgi:hypothetical protein
MADCTKKKYMTLETAMLKLREIREKSLRRGKKTGKKRHEKHAYKCMYCGFYHLTSQEPRRGK